MTVDDARSKIWGIFGDDEVRKDENYLILLINAQNFIRQEQQLLNDAADGHETSILLCNSLGLDNTLRKFGHVLKDRERVWPSKVQLLPFNGVST